MAIKLSKNGKRLGRPPKNADKSTGSTFISEPQPVKKEEVFIVVPEDAGSVIQCEFIPINQWSHVKTEDFKDGRYMTSTYQIKDFGTKKWVVAGYIKADWEKYKILRWHESEVIKRCVNYLNSVTINKKGKKKYGNLELVKYKFINKFGQDLAVLELAIDERKNDNFWGEGEKMYAS